MHLLVRSLLWNYERGISYARLNIPNAIILGEIKAVEFRDIEQKGEAEANRLHPRCCVLAPNYIKWPWYCHFKCFFPLLYILVVEFNPWTTSWVKLIQTELFFLCLLQSKARKTQTKFKSEIDSNSWHSCPSLHASFQGSDFYLAGLHRLPHVLWRQKRIYSSLRKYFFGTVC